MDYRFSKGIDVARVGACFMVVVLHVAAIEFHEFDSRWWASNFYDSFTRACVPVFLMISGALLLGRQERLSVFLRKRVMRVLPPLLFWSLFYLGWNHHQGQDYGGVLGGVATIFQGPVSYHLWYLYAIVGIYLFMPFLRHIWQSASQAEKHMYLAIWVLVSAAPIVEKLLQSDVDVLNTYELGTFFGLAGYVFLGAYVHETFARHVTKPAYWWFSASLFVLFSLATMLLTWLYSVRLGQPDPLFYDYLSPLVIGAAVCAFNILYGIGVSLPRAASRPLLSSLASCSLGIYCLHIFLLDVVNMNTNVLHEGPSGWWLTPAFAGLIFVATWLLIALLRTVRPLRHVM